MKYPIQWTIKLSLCSLMLVSSLNAQKFHIAGHLVKCAGNDKLPANSIFFIEGNIIPPDCIKIMGAGDAVPVAKGAIYNQDNVQGMGLPGGLWRRSGGTIKSNLENIKLNEVAIKGGNKNIGIGSSLLEKNTNGRNNIAIGSSVLESNTGGSNNIALGELTLGSVSSGNHNVAIGHYTGFEIQHKNKTTTLGYMAPGVDSDGTFSVGYNRKTLMSIDSAGYLHTIANTDDTPIFYHGNEDHKAYTFQNKDGTMTISAKSGKKILNLKNGDTEHLTVSKDGYVGIGTDKPSYPLHIEKTKSTSLETPIVLFHETDSHLRTAGGSSTYFEKVSIYTQGSIITKEEIAAASDARIKINKGLTNSQEDLETLNKIRVTNYIKKDPRERHHSVEKRVIAQELEQVYPTAVSTNQDVVPDIYLFSQQTSLRGNSLEIEVNTSLDKDQQKNTIAVIEHQKSLLALQTVKKGENFKLLIFEDNEKGNLLSEINQVALTQVGQNGKKLRFVLKPEDRKKLNNKPIKVLVYGRQVDDLRTVDYNAVAMLNVSATQALSKKMAEMQTKIEILETEKTQKDNLIYSLVGVLFVLVFVNMFRNRRR